MISLKLKLRYGEHPLRQTTAWFIPGDNVAQWIDVMVAGQIAQSNVRFLPIPESGSGAGTVGALMIGGVELPAKTPLGCMGFGNMGHRLYLPVEAKLDPGVTDAELERLLPLDTVCVWHPRTGIVAFESREQMPVSDLLEVCSPTESGWNKSMTGIVLAKRLSGLVANARLDIESVMDAGRDDIGSQSQGWSQLPPDPREPGTGLVSSGLRQVGKLAAGAIHWIVSKVPRPDPNRNPAPGANVSGEEKPGWIDRVQRWAAAQIMRITAEIEEARNREINRLMKLLEENPDEGLKYALPLTGDPHRGRAPPNTSLTRRDSTFSLGRTSGGPADIWDLSNERRSALMRNYRELANREMNLGRYRRAAYIFAELLGDFQGATGALAAGKHFREAAVICRNRLNAHLRTAEYLEQGGLWTEAIAVYVELAQHEKAGDLYRKIGLNEEAVQQYNATIETLRSQANHFAAAKILDEKLDSPRRAIQELSAGWPASSQSFQCLNGIFEILGRTGLHEESKDWLRGFRKGQSPGSDHSRLVEVVAQVATQYPDHSVRSLAADGTRVIVARSLKDSGTKSASHLLHQLARLDSNDRLLGGDCQRFGQVIRDRETRKTSSRKAVSRQQEGHRKRVLATVRSIMPFPLHAEWKTAITCGEQIFLATILDGQLWLARSGWEQVERPGKSWPTEFGNDEAPVLLSACPSADRHLLVKVPGVNLPAVHHHFGALDICASEIIAGPVGGVGEYCIGAVRGETDLPGQLKFGEES